MFWNVLLWLFAVGLLAVVAWTLGETVTNSKNGKTERRLKG